MIYLSRVRYSSPKWDAIHQGSTSSTTGGRARHTVKYHLRRVREASAAQRFLAQRYGIEVPPGFTFVRAHERGAGAAEARARVYRSRSASRMLFEAIDVAIEGSRPAWFEFEKDCARLLEGRGFQIHRAANRDGDGGVDLYAVDPDGAPWVVQCKCWAIHREVPPAVIRELTGAIALADAGAEQHSRGMVITTSRFSRGATKAAAQLSYELIDGQNLAGMLASHEELTSPSP